MEATFSGAGEVRPAHAFDQESFAGWLCEHCPDIGPPTGIRQFNGGQSNPTYLIESRAGRFVLRRKPPGQLLSSAHAVDREHRVIRALSEQCFPVPTPLAYCDDPSIIGSAFYIMNFVEGRIFWDPKLPELPRSERGAIYEAMVATLAALHSIDPAAAGLSDFGKPGDYFTRQIDRWTHQYRASVEEPIAPMEFLIDWLAASMPPAGENIAVIHGDYRLDNMIFHPTEPRVLAVLDWELSTLGHPLGDLSYQAMQWRMSPGFYGSLSGADRRDLGLPDEGCYVRAYLDRMGWDEVPLWEHYIVYNFFRFASVLFGVGKRFRDGVATNARAAEFEALAFPVAQQGRALAQSLSAR